MDSLRIQIQIVLIRFRSLVFDRKGKLAALFRSFTLLYIIHTFYVITVISHVSLYVIFIPELMFNCYLCAKYFQYKIAF